MTHSIDSKATPVAAAARFAITPARPADLDAIAALLVPAGLPPEGLKECLGSALVARGAGVDAALLGAVALELYGEHAQYALLRSLVVAPAERSGGLGGVLVAGALDLARRRGVREVFLLTETAATFFAGRGFDVISRAAVPAPVQESVQFRSVCPQSATVMSHVLPLDSLS